MKPQTVLLVAVLLLVETSLASFASYCLKRSSSGEGMLSMIKSPFFYAGGVLYVISAGMSIALLQFLPYAIVLPLGSLTYVWTLFISRKLLGEEISKRKLLGVAVIICGVILLAAGQI